MSKVILLPALCVWTVVSTAAAVPIGGIFGMGMWSYMLTEELPNYYKNSDSNFILNANSNNSNFYKICMTPFIITGSVIGFPVSAVIGSVFVPFAHMDDQVRKIDKILKS